MSLEPKIYFVTGVCGSGKTTVIPYLKSLLQDQPFEIHDFDERGVPDNATRQWNLDEIAYWIAFGLPKFKAGVSTIICGFANPEEVPDEHVRFLLLDASAETIRQCIINRYQTDQSQQELKRVVNNTVTEFIQNNVSFLATLRTICERDARCQIVDTNDKPPAKVAQELVENIL